MSVPGLCHTYGPHAVSIPMYIELISVQFHVSAGAAFTFACMVTGEAQLEANMPYRPDMMMMMMMMTGADLFRPWMFWLMAGDGLGEALSASDRVLLLKTKVSLTGYAS